MYAPFLLKKLNRILLGIYPFRLAKKRMSDTKETAEVENTKKEQTFIKTFIYGGLTPNAPDKEIHLDITPAEICTVSKVHPIALIIGSHSMTYGMFVRMIDEWKPEDCPFAMQKNKIAEILSLMKGNMTVTITYDPPEIEEQTGIARLVINEINETDVKYAKYWTISAHVIRGLWHMEQSEIAACADWVRAKYIS